MEQPLNLNKIHNKNKSLCLRRTKNKRLRKKLFLDEFAVFGFELTFSLDEEYSFDSLVDKLIEFIEGRKLSIGGGGDRELFNAIVCSESRYGSATNQDRNALTKLS